MINMSATDTNLGINITPFPSQFFNKPVIHISMNLVHTHILFYSSQKDLKNAF